GGPQAVAAGTHYRLCDVGGGAGPLRYDRHIRQDRLFAMQVDLGNLGFEEGGYLLVKRLLRSVPAGEQIEVTGTAPELETHLRAWCRPEGHPFRWERFATIVRGGAEAARWSGSDSAGGPTLIVEHAPRTWGLAARGATVEAGAPEFDFRLADK